MFGRKHELVGLNAEELCRFDPRYPLLESGDAFLFSYGPRQATEWERGVIERRGLRGIAVDEVAADPEGAAAAALAELEPRFDRLLVHFDVDTVDFTDTPLSENAGRNEGLPLEVAMRALNTVLGTERLGALAVTELNPDHGDEGGGTVELFAQALADSLGGSPVLGRRCPG